MEFKFEDITAAVEVEGAVAARPKFGAAARFVSEADCVCQYRVTVTIDGDTYTADAHGSIADYQEGRAADDDTLRGIAAMVVDELLMAACDADEFAAMAGFEEGEVDAEAAREMGEERGTAVMAVIDFAARHEAELFDAEAAVRRVQEGV